MRKIILAFLLMAVATGPVLAQTQTPYGKSDPRAKEILDAASKKFKTYNSVKADFVLKILTADNKQLDSRKGTVYLKGNKYKVLLGGQEIYSDGQTMWTYNKDTKEVQVSNYSPENATISPARLFSDFYDKEFLYRLNGKDTYNGKPVYVIEMTPLDKSKPFFKVVAKVDQKSKNIVSAEIFEKGGNRYVYQVTSFSPNADISDSAFVFDPKAHPGVEVVDLR